MKKLLSLCLAPMLLLAGPSFAKEAATAEAAQQARPALWVVRDHDTTIYLFGTVHVLRPEIQWLNGGIKAAFDRSEELVVEVVDPPKDVMANAIMRLGITSEGPALSDKLSPEARAKYQ